MQSTGNVVGMAHLSILIYFQDLTARWQFRDLRISWRQDYLGDPCMGERRVQGLDWCGAQDGD